MLCRAEQLPLHVAAAMSMSALAAYGSVQMDGEEIEMSGVSAPSYSCRVPSFFGSPSKNFTITPDELLFQRLVLKWHEEYGISSSTTEIVTSPSYQRIIGMGERPLP